ncbi:cytochrome P450 [Sinobacterium caligoides]|uniref:Cytochrome P450 n=2 Tax=Sinobacterium caligoides TaxID=933926 RepID=A0A3N2DMU0_9GAMM|nr:cytochrome P450 [Sinobacterium caligoides]
MRGIAASIAWRERRQPPRTPPAPIAQPQTPEDFQPLSPGNFANPYAYYELLRNDHPVYRMPGHDYYCISRYDDICSLAKNTTAYSSKIMEILVSGKPKDPNTVGDSPVEKMGNWGIIPVDVLALQDPPLHAAERKIGHSGFNARFVKSLEPEVRKLCHEMMDELLPQGEIEFVQDFAWRLPMRLIIRLLGFPEGDYEQIKTWCMEGIRSLSGTAGKAELVRNGAGSAAFMRYLWRHYLIAKQRPQDNFTGHLIRESADPDSVMTDQRAIAILLQLLIAGSDSSASSMGSAIRILAQRPELEHRLREDYSQINNFIEEVFRTEAAFQGHFRVSTCETTLHDTTIPAGARVFLMWASGNRDERYYDNPEQFDMDRPKLKKHLTFGHGVHACIGRELARMEIRIVIEQLLQRTKQFSITGDAPFEASIFARTLLRLPMRFELAEQPPVETQPAPSTSDTAVTNGCPFH